MKYQKIILLLCWASFIAVVAVLSLSSNVGQPSRFHLDKVLHFSGYCFMAFLAPLWASNRGQLIAATLVLVALGLLTEYGQSFVPSRYPSVGDIIANMAGIAAGISASLWLKTRFKSQ